MKIVGFVGSPRIEGNTQKLVELILTSAAENGAETKIFNLNKMEIKGCQACLHCKTTNEGCAIKDDMQQLFEEIKEADAVIIGSPIYMGQMSAQSKLFTDRHFAYIGRNIQNRLGKKDLVLVFTQGNPNIEQFSQYIDYTSKMYGFLGYNVKDTLIGAGLRKIGAINKEDKLIQKAKRLGEELVN